jgi:TolA-binding protein
VRFHVERDRAEFLARFTEAAAVPDELEELTSASNAAADLVRAGKLEEAEAAARDLLKRFPESTTGGTGSAWCMRRAAKKPRPPTATARPSRSSERSPKVTTRPSATPSSSSSLSSILRPQAKMTIGRCAHDR